jgi:hypothetical protein
MRPSSPGALAPDDGLEGLCGKAGAGGGKDNDGAPVPGGEPAVGEACGVVSQNEEGPHDDPEGEIAERAERLPPVLGRERLGGVELQPGPEGAVDGGGEGERREERERTPECGGPAIAALCGGEVHEGSV